MVGSSKLLSSLPKSYIAATTAAERIEHFDLFRRFDGGSDVLLSWAPSPEETAYIHVYAVFRDAIGSLSAITSTLTDAGINVHRVTAFVTAGVRRA